MKRRVVITGAGAVSPFGFTHADLASGLAGTTSCVHPVTRFDASPYACRVAAEVDDAGFRDVFRPTSYSERRMGRFVQFGLVAAEEALEAAQIGADGACGAGGVFAGISGMSGLEEAGLGGRAADPGSGKADPMQFLTLLPNVASGQIALRGDFAGPQVSVAGACAAGLQAIGLALAAIRTGELRWAVAGGSESLITPLAFAGLEALLLLSARGSATPRPFDDQADGMVLGEGAAFFVLEEAEHARGRGAHVLAEVRGYATTSGGESITLHSVDAVRRCVQHALADAQLDARDVDCIVAHATGLRTGDDHELSALREIFPAGAAAPTLTSVKGHVGHSLAASGPFSLAAALQALRAQEVPPTCHFGRLDAAHRGLDVASRPRPRRVRHCLVNAFGFGGVNAATVLSAASFADTEKSQERAS